MRITKNKNVDILIVAFGFGLAYWFLDSLLCYIYNDSVSFASELFQPSTQQTYSRIIVICFLVLFNSHNTTKYEKLEEGMEDLKTQVDKLQQTVPPQQGSPEPAETGGDKTSP